MSPPSPANFALRSYTPGQRLAAALLNVLAAVNLLELAARFAADLVQPLDAPRLPLPLLVERLFFFSLLPALAGAAFRMAAWARWEQRAEHFILSTRSAHLEVPWQSVAELRPWRVPLPTPGFDLVLRSGRRLPLSFAVADPRTLTSLATTLAAAAGLNAFVPPPMWRDAVARRRLRRLHYAPIKLGLVPAIVTFIVFRLHQLINFGGLFGEYYQLGLRHYLDTLLGVSLYVFGNLLVVSAGLRAAVELVALATARLPPRPARLVRYALEGLAAVAYYGGLAALLAIKLGV